MLKKKKEQKEKKEIHTAGFYLNAEHHFLKRKKNYERFLHLSHSVSIQLAFSKCKPDVVLEFIEAHWKTSEWRGGEGEGF